MKTPMTNPPELFAALGKDPAQILGLAEYGEPLLFDWWRGSPHLLRLPVSNALRMGNPFGEGYWLARPSG